jgi:uncharacterized protein YegJ (DUF2314 family)
MNNNRWFGLAVSFALIALFACSKSDYTIDVAEDDPEMTAAIAQARATLPQFWDVFEKRERNETDFLLKVGITDKGETEYFWLKDIERLHGMLMGTIDNEPEIVGTVKLGDRIEIPEADIVDWIYKRDGKIVGNRTVRALFKHMSPEEVEQTKAMLAEP